mgnify:FL=1
MKLSKAQKKRLAFLMAKNAGDTDLTPQEKIEFAGLKALAAEQEIEVNDAFVKEHNVALTDAEKTELADLHAKEKRDEEEDTKHAELLASVEA